MAINGGCGCRARQQSLVVGGPGMAAVVQGLATLDAVSTAHALSSWAARRLPPAERATFGDASGAPGRGIGHVSSGGRYHPPAPSSSPSSARVRASAPRVAAAGGASSVGSAWSRRRVDARATTRGARVGQVPDILATDSGMQARVSSLDRDWNALAVSVCGAARGLACDTPTSRALGPAWVGEFQSALGDWRSFRDDFRQSVLQWGLDTGSQLDAWQRELERFRGDVTRVTHQAPTATTLTPPSVTAALAEGAGSIARDVAAPIGIALGGLLVIGGLVMMANRR